VENFVTVKPARVRLSGIVGHSIAVPVTIIPEEKYPFEIVDVKAKDGRHIRYDLNQRPTTEGKGYTLLVENVKKEKGRYHDVIRLRTNSPIKPQIQIRVSGYIRDE
jgi:hypothetical protein